MIRNSMEVDAQTDKITVRTGASIYIVPPFVNWTPTLRNFKLSQIQIVLALDLSLVEITPSSEAYFTHPC